MEKALCEREIRNPKAYGVTIARNSLAREFSAPERPHKEKRCQDQDTPQSKEKRQKYAAVPQSTVEIKNKEALGQPLA